MISSRAVRPPLGVLGWIFAALWLTSWSLTHAQSPTDEENAPHRPRIGLVLSGGGARGAAHVGVLKVLEQMQVPIDAIAGTSMGAVVGGLYASGLNPREIESIMNSLNWQDAFRDRPPREDLTFRRKLEDQNFLVKFPLGVRGHKIQLPTGLISGQKLNQTLRRLTLPVAEITNFDDLPTPFRAVGTDLETGDAVIMDSGDLTSAMRASMSAPGVFSPVEREGRLLVDGGLVDNVPIDVAKAMGVDILIVVDVGAPLLKRDKLSSVPVISNQMLAIMIQRNAREQLRNLGKEDVLIAPTLGDTSSFDFGIVTRMIATGERAGKAAEPRLASLAIGAQEYASYVARRDGMRQSAPKIQFVKVEEGSERYANRLNRVFKDVIGKPLDPDAVARHITTIYGQGNLQALDYQVIQDEDDRYGLLLNAHRNSWGPNYVRFGLSLEDDFQGNSTYNAAARLVLSEITQPGGEWVWDFQVGQTSLVYTEVYLPISDTSSFFVVPHVQTEAQNVFALDGQLRIAEYRVRSYDYGFDVGRELGNWGEIRTGIEREQGSENVRVGDPLLPSDSFDTRDYFIRFSYDKLDNINFPRRGQQATVEWRSERQVGTVSSSQSGAPISSRSDETFDRLAFSYVAAGSFGRYTAVFSAAGGTTIDAPPGLALIGQTAGPGGTTFTTPSDLRLLFPLGGFLNLSGLKANSIAGPHFAIARTLFYKQIGRGGPGYLDVPTYVGLSFEMGNVWNHLGDASFGNTRRDVSIFLGMDTFLGPVYIASGWDDKGSNAFYLFLGRTF